MNNVQAYHNAHLEAIKGFGMHGYEIDFEDLVEAGGDGWLVVVDDVVGRVNEAEQGGQQLGKYEDVNENKDLIQWLINN